MYVWYTILTDLYVFILYIELQKLCTVYGFVSVGKFGVWLKYSICNFTLSLYMPVNYIMSQIIFHNKHCRVLNAYLIKSIYTDERLGPGSEKPSRLVFTARATRSRFWTMFSSHHNIFYPWMPPPADLINDLFRNVQAKRSVYLLALVQQVFRR